MDLSRFSFLKTDDGTPVSNRHAERFVQVESDHHIADYLLAEASRYQTGGRTYQVQVRFTPTSGDAYIAALYELHAVEVLGD